MTNTVEAVVFDLDGVLLASEGQWDEVRRGVAAEAGRPWPAEATRAMQGMSTGEWSRYLTDLVGVPGAPETVAATVIDRMVNRFRTRLPLLPGAVEVVQRLSSHWPLGLASSSPRRLIDAVLESAGLADRFAVSVSTEEVGAGKPSPAVYQEATRRLGVEPARAVAIEDSTNGLRSAARAGLAVIAVPNGAYPPAEDALALAATVVRSLDEISPELVASAAGRGQGAVPVSAPREAADVTRTLVVNAGSSSLKLSVLTPEGAVAAATTVEQWEGRLHLEPVHRFLETSDRIDAVGHRVVHGGPRYREAVRIDGEVLDYLDSIRDLAPLHNPRAVAAIRAVGDLLPQVPAVACFDTAFHATLPAEASTYALPREWNARWGLRRYGFHGLSHSYASRRATEMVDADGADLRVVSCHLGAGASLAAVRAGISLDTTMGFTPLAGLVMATRSGDVDPGLLMWLLQHGGVAVDDLDSVLENRSGLRGLSGTSGDLREVLAGRAAGDPDCALAFDVFLHQLCREIAAMTAGVGGLDVLVMTGGIGEHAPEVRAQVATRLAFLGIEVDRHANESVTGDTDISSAGAAVRTVVVTAREDLEIARQVRHLLPQLAGA